MGNGERERERELRAREEHEKERELKGGVREDRKWERRDCVCGEECEKRER